MGWKPCASAADKDWRRYSNVLRRSRLLGATLLSVMALPSAAADKSTQAEAPPPGGMAAKLIAHYHMQRIPLLLHPDGHGRKVILGANVLAGELPQFTVPRAVWQGSTPRGTSPQRHALFGDQLSPAFLYEDFEVGYRDALQQRRRLELI